MIWIEGLEKLINLDKVEEIVIATRQIPLPPHKVDKIMKPPTIEYYYELQAHFIHGGITVIKHFDTLEKAREALRGIFKKKEQSSDDDSRLPPQSVYNKLKD